MKMTPVASKAEAELWMRILYPEAEMSPQAASAILRLSFPKADVKRMRELSAKARDGRLTAEDHAEMDNFERVGSTLSILKSKARQVLKRSRRGA
jgi:hypothetical protein